MPNLLREVGVKTHTRRNDIQPPSIKWMGVILAFEESSISIIHIQAPEAILYISQPPPSGCKHDKAKRERLHGLFMMGLLPPRSGKCSLGIRLNHSTPLFWPRCVMGGMSFNCLDSPLICRDMSMRVGICLMSMS